MIKISNNRLYYNKIRRFVFIKIKLKKEIYYGFKINKKVKSI